jgi:hypothetical protein
MCLIFDDALREYNSGRAGNYMVRQVSYPKRDFQLACLSLVCFY